MNTPLDEPLGFTPAEDERPAGAWMEGYWKELSLWALRFAYAVFAFCSMSIFIFIQQVFQMYQTGQQGLVSLFFLRIAFYAPRFLLGYYSLKFGLELSRVMKTGNQITLEKALLYLRYCLIAGLVIAGIWLVSEVYRWRILIEY